MSLKSSSDRPLRCGELARLAGVSPDTVRYYERRGLLPKASRTASGYRLFPPDSLKRVRVIRRALSLGLGVGELARVFRERDSGGTPCHRVRKLVSEKLAEIEAALRELQSWRRELRSTLAAWDGVLAQTPKGTPARLLEVFPATNRKSHARTSGLRILAFGNRTQEKQR